MLWRMAILSGLFYAAMAVGTAHAQTSPLDAIQATINYLKPTPEVGAFVKLKDLGDGNLSDAESFAGVSGSLWTITDNDIELGSLRLGGQFEGDRKLWNAIGLNGVGIAKRYLPDSVKTALSPGFMGSVWGFTEKYAHVSAGLGLDDVQDFFSDGYEIGDHLGLVGTLGVKVAW